MCGITGIIQFDKKPVEKNLLLKMTRRLSHRGPDDEGFYIDRNIGLGHRRLSIIDLSPAGHQPMFYDNRNLAIIYNGEIYNYLEIRQELQKEGYKFKSQTDTEVILASYKKWGFDCLKHFNGMWSFVIFDRKKNILFCACDRLGVKPFYYFLDNEKFLFASEIKAILAHPEVKAQANDHTIWDYLITGWLDHSSETFFKNIFELRGGHYLILKNGKPAGQRGGLEIKKYWDLKIQKTSQNDQEIYQRFQELFTNSIRLRLRSDVPLGTCLSGGLDSSAIVSLVNRFINAGGDFQIGKWQKTFSSVWNTAKIDESKFINEMIKATGARSYRIYPTAKNLTREIKRLIWHQDLPFSTTSIYAQWCVFQQAKGKVKVILDGQGADELLAGYTGYFGLYFLSLLKKGNLGKLFLEFGMFLKNHWREKGIFSELIMRGLQAGWLGNYFSSLYHRLSFASEIFENNFYSRFREPQRYQFSQDFFTNALYNSLKMNLSSLLRYEDRNSMAFSIESRVPFLDYRLVEFIFSLPHDQKIRQGQTKWVMRQALKGILPEKIRIRQDKIGFATPEEIWMKEELGRKMKEVFSSASFNQRGYFVPGKTEEFFEKYLQGKIGNYQLFWRLYCLEMWFRVFID